MILCAFGARAALESTSRALIMIRDHLYTAHIFIRFILVLIKCGN